MVSSPVLFCLFYIIHEFDMFLYQGIAVITVEPADKISFVYNCMQTRLRGQYNGK